MMTTPTPLKKTAEDIAFDKAEVAEAEAMREELED